jgi:hypothetical protein
MPQTRVQPPQTRSISTASNTMDDNTVRRRADASTPQSPKDESSDPQSPPKTRQKIDKKPPSRAGGGVSIMTVLRVVGGLALLSSAMSWFITGDSVLWGWKPWFFSMSAMESWLVRFFFFWNHLLSAVSAVSSRYTHFMIRSEVSTEFEDL